MTTKYLYPPNWEGNIPDDQRTGWKRVVFRCTNVSDGTGESNVVKLDISDWRCTNGVEPKRTVVEWIEYQLQGMGVRIEWDRAPRSMIAQLVAGSDDADSGMLDFRPQGGLVDDGLDDRSGDILFTTLEHAANDSYDITMSVRFKDT